MTQQQTSETAQTHSAAPLVDESRSGLQPESPLAARLSRFGLMSRQRPEEWQGEPALPSELAAFYRTVGPENMWIDSLGDPILTFALDSLWGAQAGFRWNRRTGARLVDWDDEWFAVALHGDVPWIFDSRTSAVLLPDGDLGWEDREEEPVPVFENLAEAFTAIAVLGEVYAAYEADPFTDELHVRPGLVADVLTALEGVFPERHSRLGSAQDRARAVALAAGYPLEG
ncbi:hypothetical protein [Arthrobacter sp. UM1]|uniref:hypothetical protein n=1 Tax=Arthrobacter sp. UM1 TaxID=2766776 RepID=UPI001CF70DB9|nr:hypothetical protein [Arthrobacter sp. UM1]MCB4208378.1 hypothetical protein [Arthrobacter sp. UM1]